MSAQPQMLAFADGALNLHAGPVATLELNQPARRNAMSAAMWLALPRAIAAVAADEMIRVLLVRGAGHEAFCAGADISEFGAVYADPEATAAYNSAVRSAQAALRDLPRPTIAVIEGVCIGGGCGLALACDLRFSSATAQFAITPAKLGLAYSFADTAQLVEKVGPARAKDILFSGRQIAAIEALAIGLVDRVAEASSLEAEIGAYAELLSSLSQTSIRTAKAMINAMAAGAAPAPADMSALFAASFEGQDFREGYQAFMQKRQPRFRY